jgi:hypothetical protein
MSTAFNLPADAEAFEFNAIQRQVSGVRIGVRINALSPDRRDWAGSPEG